MTEAEEWNRNMLAFMRASFPLSAKAEAGRWYLYGATGECLARFHLDTGHLARMLAASDLALAMAERVGPFLTALKAIPGLTLPTDAAIAWKNLEGAACAYLEKARMTGWRHWQLPPVNLFIYGDWRPTPENINALPEPLRQYVAALETRADPSGEFRELIQARDTIKALEARVAELSEALSEGVISDDG